jgi:hypothetical protein
MIVKAYEMCKQNMSVEHMKYILIFYIEEYFLKLRRNLDSFYWLLLVIGRTTARILLNGFYWLAISVLLQSSFQRIFLSFLINEMEGKGNIVKVGDQL